MRSGRCAAGAAGLRDHALVDRGETLPSATKYTVKDYLALDAASEQRNELLNGDVRAMAGAEPEHNVLKGNIARELGNRLLERGCRVMSLDQRVQLGENYVYPDVVVACAPEYADPRPRSLLNPDLIVEVTSATTTALDRGEKLIAYTALDSLHQYWSAEADRALITQYVRRDDDWLLRAYTGLDAVLHSPHFEVDVPLERFMRWRLTRKYPEPGIEDISETA